MKPKNETPEVTDDATTPKKRISLRREKVRSLNVQSGVQGGALVTVVDCPVGVGGRGCPRSLIICIVSTPD